MTIKILKIFINNGFPIQWHHVLYYIFLVLIIPHSGFWFDLNNDWPRWSAYALEHGLGQIYQSDTNYMPFYLHGLYWFGKLQGSKELIYQNSYQLKYFFLLFDFAGAIALSWALKKYHQRLWVEYFLLLNIAYLYATTIWGQLDSVPTSFIILTIICLFQQRLLWATAFAILAVYTKLQAIIFVPFFVILFGIYLYQKFDWVLIFKILVVFFFTNLLLLLPFIVAGTFWNFIKVVRESVGFFPKVSWNAYNLWYLLLKQDPTQIFDTQAFGGLTYKKWGFLLFFGGSFIIFMPFLLQTFQILKSKTKQGVIFYTTIWLTMATISVWFFFVNTQMHERYSFPAIAFYFAFGLLSGRYLLLLLVSIAHLINVDGVNHYFGLQIIKPEIVSLLFGLILLVSFYELYRFRNTETVSV